MVTGYAPLGGPGETTVADGFTLLENPTGMSSINYFINYFSYCMNHKP